MATILYNFGERLKDVMDNTAAVKLIDTILPLRSIKVLTANSNPIVSAEFRSGQNDIFTIVLLTSSHRILIARKQGDIPRTWRSADRAIDFLKTHFAISLINVHLLEK